MRQCIIDKYEAMENTSKCVEECPPEEFLEFYRRVNKGLPKEFTLGEYLELNDEVVDES